MGATTKLTLSIDPEVIRDAKHSAAAAHTSVSALVARLFRAMSESNEKPLPIGPITTQATGLAKVASGVSDAELLGDALASKYGMEP